MMVSSSTMGVCWHHWQLYYCHGQLQKVDCYAKGSKHSEGSQNQGSKESTYRWGLSRKSHMLRINLNCPMTHFAVDTWA
jgi:hypothetical protein